MTRAAVESLALTAPGPSWARRPAVYLELSKARLSALVVVTASVGFVMASPLSRGEFDWLGLAATTLGTALAAFSANAFNQVWEVTRDARMVRTCRRPLPTRRLTLAPALAWAAGTGAGGVLLLGLATHVLAAALALANIGIYVLAYTPLKPRHPSNTLVGAVVGAVPPMLGWAAATGRLDAGAWVLGGTLFLWQVPHFLSLAWLYRADYERGGFRMLPAIDQDGRLTAGVSLVYALALLPVSLAMAWTGLTGWVYALGALALGGWMVWLALRFLRCRQDGQARRLFFASILYLPAILALMTADRAWLHP